MSAQLPLSLTPASRARDGMGSVDAEEAHTRSGRMGGNQRLVLAGFVRYPMRTTKELAALTLPKGMELSAWRTEVARRASGLEGVYLTKIAAPPGTPKGEREFRWNPTATGKRVVEGWK